MSKVKTGLVVSNKMDKSIVVQVDRMVTHPLYGKRYRVSKKFIAHDETNSATIGDTAVIRETKPISKRKSWILVSRTPAVTTAQLKEAVMNPIETEAPVESTPDNSAEPIEAGKE